MTTPEALTQFEKLVAVINFHVQDKNLREKLVEFLNLDFVKARLLTAPASSQHHQAEAGGLLSHTNDVVRYAIVQCQLASQRIIRRHGLDRYQFALGFIGADRHADKRGGMRLLQLR